MHSPYSSNNQSFKLGDVVPLADISNAPIPSVSPNVFFEGAYDLDDANSTFDVVAFRTSIASSPSSMTLFEDDTKKPRACRDLQVLVTKEEPDNKATSPLFRRGPRSRLESFLDVQLQEKDEGVIEQSNKGETFETKTKMTKSSFRPKSFQKARNGNSIDHTTRSSVVWVIEPSFNKDGTLSFKFTTDAGACLILRDKEALESIEIMRSSSRSNAYFQLFSIEGKESRVIKPEKIAEAIEETIAASKLKVEDKDVLTSEATNIARYWLGRRFYRFLLRRRWKKLIHRQVRIATGGSNKPRLLSTILPIAIALESFGRRKQKERNRAAI